MMKTSTSTSARLWAIRVGKYVEIRSCPARPKRLVSKLTKTPQPASVFSLIHSGSVVLKQTFFVGGHTVDYFPAEQFGAHIGRKLRTNTLVEVPTDYIQPLLTERTREKLHKLWR